MIWQHLSVSYRYSLHIYLMWPGSLEHWQIIAAITLLASIYLGCCLVCLFLYFEQLFSLCLSLLVFPFPRKVCLGSLRSLPLLDQRCLSSLGFNPYSSRVSSEAVLPTVIKNQLSPDPDTSLMQEQNWTFMVSLHLLELSECKKIVNRPKEKHQYKLLWSPTYY